MVDPTRILRPSSHEEITLAHEAAAFAESARVEQAVARLELCGNSIAKAVSKPLHLVIFGVCGASHYAELLEKIGDWIDTGDPRLAARLPHILTRTKDELNVPGVEAFLRDCTAPLERLRAEHLAELSPTDYAGLDLQVAIRNTLFASRCLQKSGALAPMMKEMEESLKVIAAAMTPQHERIRPYLGHLQRCGIEAVIKSCRSRNLSSFLDEFDRQPVRTYFSSLIQSNDATNHLSSTLRTIEECRRGGVLEGVITEGLALASLDANTALHRSAHLLKDAGIRLACGGAPGEKVQLILASVPAADAPALLPILALDDKVKRLTELLQGSGALAPETQFGRWLLIHRDRTLDLGGGPQPMIDLMIEKAVEKKGLRAPVAAIIRNSDALFESNLLEKAAALLIEKLDPAFMVKRIDRAGAVIAAGNPGEALEILSNGAGVDAGSKRAPARPIALSSAPTKTGQPIQTLLNERLEGLPRVQAWLEGALSSSVSNGTTARCLRSLIARTRGETRAAAQFLYEYGSDDRLAEVLASSKSFERLVEFLTNGKREEVKRFNEWLRVPNAAPPAVLDRIIGAPQPASAPAVHSTAAALRHPDILIVPPGDYARLLVIGGNYSAGKRERIQTAAGDVAVEFVSPDVNFRDLLRSVGRRDLIVINPTQNSHSASGKVLDHCRANGVNWMILPFSGYERLLDIAAHISR